MPAFLKRDDLRTGEPLPGWKGRFWSSKSMSFAQYDFSAGASIHEHHHEQEEVWIVVVGELEVTIDGETAVAGAGDVAVVPSDTRHSVRARSDGRAVIADYPLRGDI
jgi:quercetin dioxygenase-like cupin family protein